MKRILIFKDFLWQKNLIWAKINFRQARAIVGKFESVLPQPTWKLKSGYPLRWVFVEFAVLAPRNGFLGLKIILLCSLRLIFFKSPVRYFLVWNILNKNSSLNFELGSWRGKSLFYWVLFNKFHRKTNLITQLWV
jgi:hypothetical protein